MSFSPLPDALDRILVQLSRVPGARLLDLGCGEGSLPCDLLSGRVTVIGLDRVPPWRGSRAQVVGDALSPPFRAGGFELVVAANLFRHLLTADPAGDFLRLWQGLLRPGGMLFILEDQPPAPGGDDPARANYQAFQAFLARLHPEGRRPLLDLRSFLRWLDKNRQGPSRWVTGVQDNTWPADTQAVLAMLAGDGGVLDPSVEQLVRSIRRHGLHYGKYWWAACPAGE